MPKKRRIKHAGRTAALLLMIWFLIISVAFIGCIEENEVAPSTPAPASIDPTVTPMTQPEIKGDIPEIAITSYYSVYIRSNRGRTHLSEECYALYNLSVRNNGSSTLMFSLDHLHLSAGDRIFKAADPETINFSKANLSKRIFFACSLDACSNLDKEKKLERGVTILPNQTIYGYVVFDAGDYHTLSNRSFSLKYNNRHVTSASFEKSLAALTAAEFFDYSAAFKTPPYTAFAYDEGFYDPGSSTEWAIYARWVNRSVFEYYKTIDLIDTKRCQSRDMPISSDTAYMLRIMPEMNVTVSQSPMDRFFVVDERGDEIINRSKSKGIAILSNQTYKLYLKNLPRMNFSNATVVQISFESSCGADMAMRLTMTNQDVIFDKDLDVVLARYYYKGLIS